MFNRHNSDNILLITPEVIRNISLSKFNLIYFLYPFINAYNIYLDILISFLYEQVLLLLSIPRSSIDHFLLKLQDTR